LKRFDFNNKRKLGADTYVFAALFFVSFSLLLFSTRSFVIDIRDTGLSVFSGVRGGVHSISSFFVRTVNSVSELSALREKHNELLNRMTRYEELERNAAEIQQENYRLREQLGFSKTLVYKHIPAEIIGRDPDNLFQTLVINKGQRHGVKKDMPVIAYQGGVEALTGKIVQAAQFESLVMPLYDERCFVAARFAQSRYEGIVAGKGDRIKPLLMQSIDRRAKEAVQRGDVIISSGLGGVYPAGIAIGRVNNILSSEPGTALEVELEPAINFSKLEYVFVIDINIQSQAQTQTEPQAQVQIQTEVQAQSQVQPQVQRQTQAQVEPQAQQQVQARTQTRTQTQTRVQTQPQVQPQVQTQVQPQVQAQPQVQPQVEFQAQNESEEE
jgi:rod shape-determining protein MreC